MQFYLCSLEEVRIYDCIVVSPNKNNIIFQSLWLMMLHSHFGMVLFSDNSKSLV